MESLIKQLEKSFIEISELNLSISIIGKSSLGRQDNENFDLPDLIENFFPSLEMNSI